MFKRENLRKNFLRVKQNIDQNLGRAEQSKVLTEDQQENEKRVEVVKHAFQNIVKKTGAVLQASGTDFDKKLKKLPETALSVAMTESAQALGTDTLLGSICQACGECQMNLAREQVHYEEAVEQGFMIPLQTVVDVDIPSIVKLRKALNKSILDMDSAKTRLNQVVRQSQVPGANMTSAGAKADVIKDEYEEATLKMENIKDNLSIEMCNFAARESEQSSSLLMLLEAQATYHRKALEAIECCIPTVALAIKNSSAKPCYGMPLEEHLRLMCRDVALVLEACILTLLEIGMEEEGLFRIAGSAVKLKKLKACFDAHAVDMEDFMSDPHTVAGALKLYLRELPEPLLTFELYDDFIQAAVQPQEQRLQALWSVINRLPKPNYNNFRYLVKFLAKLAEKCDVNKMKPSNIAIVIGPNLIWSDKNIAPNMMDTGTVSCIIENIVTHADWFFPGAFDFHLTGYGSSPALCKEPGFANNTNTHPSDIKSSSDKKNIEDFNIKEPFKERDEGRETDTHEIVAVLHVEQSSVSLPIEFLTQKSKEGECENTSDESNPASGKYEAKSAPRIEIKTELELDFNVGNSCEDEQECGPVQSEKLQNSTEPLHVQVSQGLQVDQNATHSSSPAISPISSSQSSSSSLPVSLESYSDPINATLKRAARKPAPPPPPDKPYTVNVPGISVLAHDGSSVGGNDGDADSTSSSSSQTSRSAPLACPESPTVQHKVVGVPEKDKKRFPSGQSDRPFVAPPHRPDQAPPERPQLPSSLIPPTNVRGHQRSASAGAVISKTSGSLGNNSGVLNAGILTSSNLAESRQDDIEGGGSESINSAAKTQNVVPHGSSHTIGHPGSMPSRPPPPSVARESEDTKL